MASKFDKKKPEKSENFVAEIMIPPVALVQQV